MKIYIGEFYDLDAKLLERRLYVAENENEAQRKAAFDSPLPYGAVYYRVIEKRRR